MAEDILDRLHHEATNQHAPEAVSVLVVGAISEAIAREVAPMLARVLYPDRYFGGVLNLEPTLDGDGSFVCDVLVSGTPLSAATIGR